MTIDRLDRFAREPDSRELRRALSGGHPTVSPGGVMQAVVSAKIARIGTKKEICRFMNDAPHAAVIRPSNAPCAAHLHTESLATS